MVDPGLMSGPGISGLGVAGLAGLSVAALVWCSPRRRQAGLLAVGAGALTFQVVHAAEHVLQMGYWAMHPREAPWLTPWAATARDGLASFCSLLGSSGGAKLGSEVLHLAGNLIFLAGLAALAVVVSTSSGPIGPVAGHSACRVST